jgi:hypothetical protein
MAVLHHEGIADGTVFPARALFSLSLSYRPFQMGGVGDIAVGCIIQLVKGVTDGKKQLVKGVTIKM